MTTMMKPFLRFVMFALVLGTVHLSKGVTADGKPLAAGTYQVRLADDPPPANPTGQSAGAEKWVEFVQGGKVVGRELATVISAADMASIAKGKRPGANSTLIEPLVGNEYLRVWINKDQVNYLIHLGLSK